MRTVIIVFFLCCIALAEAKDGPQGNSTVVGAIAVDLTHSTAYPETVCRDKVNIRVACRYAQNGKERTHYFDITTDSLGYFMIPNAPAGRYILKAIECSVGQGLHFTVASEYGALREGKRHRYWGVLGGFMDANWGDIMEVHFEKPPHDDIIDLGIKIIYMDAQRRLGGTNMTKRSPNGDAPWQQMTLFDSGYRVDLRVGVDTEDGSQNLFKKTPVEYFKLGSL